MGLLRIIIRAAFHKPTQKRRPQSKVIYQERTTVVSTRTTTTQQSLCGYCHVIDGDTIVINKVKIRLAGIDAPELNHPWGQNSKWAAIKMCKGKKITAKLVGRLSHDRVVATCYLPDGTDIGAALVEVGLAIDWPKFSGGKYRHLEPLGIRKKLWRADARQKGRVFE
ncbi:MAG: thermonuclease family protein [Marinosulfonomonas sp.]|nr:thermonuclease family protein [Marinosulfonomonas sp.]